MKYYRARPVVIQAEPFEGTEAHAYALRLDRRSDGWCIETLEGAMRVNKGDYVVIGTHGERYPVRSHIFESKYEESKGGSE